MAVIDNALRALFNMASKPVLWTNASPTSTFAEQKIPIDLSGYKCIRVTCSFQTTEGSSYVQDIDIGTSAYFICWYGLSAEGSRIAQFNRTINVDAEGVDFTDCYNKATGSDANAVTNNGRVIPQKIQGIR